MFLLAEQPESLENPDKFMWVTGLASVKPYPSRSALCWFYKKIFLLQQAARQTLT